MTRARLIAAICVPLLAVATPAAAQSADIGTLQAELARARAQIDAQQAALRAQDERLKALEARLNAVAAPPAAAPARPAGTAQVAAAPPAPQNDRLEQVGEAPADADKPPEVAVLGDQGSIVTRRGQLTVESQVEYARADRNRAIFRGIELAPAILVGAFDINENRQDVLSTGVSLRYGLLSNLEVGARLPFVYRSDKSVLAPIPGSGPDAATVDSSADGNGIGDLELSARYQIRSARGGWPFLIGNLGVVIPTGTDPFKMPRNDNGVATRAATGAGFYGISPSLTAILPTDPAVLFGTVGYTKNFGRDVNTYIPPVNINRVEPGDALSFSAGIGVSLNQRTSFNLGYAHSWAFGTRTITSDPDSGAIFRSTARQMQLGRLLLGVTYRMSDRASLNWSVEVGATDDATDLRTVLRIPLTLLTGR